MCFYLLSVMAYFYVAIIIHCQRYKDIADGDMEVAMNFIKEAYPFNEETESFIRKKFDMPIPDESKEQ